MEAMIVQSDNIDNITPSTAVTVEDYTNLRNAVNTQFIGDFADAGQGVSLAQGELLTIQP